MSAPQATAGGAELKEARVLMEVPSLAIAGARPFLLLRDAAGRHALGRQIGASVSVTTPWIDPERAFDVALRVAGGDPRMTTHPTTLIGLAVAVLAVFAAAQEGARQAGVPGPLDAVTRPGDAPGEGQP